MGFKGYADRVLAFARRNDSTLLAILIVLAGLAALLGIGFGFLALEALLLRWFLGFTGLLAVTFWQAVGLMLVLNVCVSLVRRARR